MRITLLGLICGALLLSSCNKADRESAAVPEKTVAVPNPNKVNTDATEIAVTKVSAAIDDEKVWGTIKGKIVVKGDVPAPVKIPLIKLVGAAAGKGPVLDPGLIVSEDGGLKNAFVFLYLGKEPQNPPVHPCYALKAKDKIELNSIFRIYEPHVVALRTSQILLAKNSDARGNNVQNNSRVNPFNRLIPVKDAVELEMKGPEKLPTQISSSIFPWMTAFIIVRDEPYVAITDQNGNFEIRNMPAGEWQFQFWHERCGYMTALEKAGKPLMEGRPAKVTLKVTDGEILDLGELTIDAAAFDGD